MSDSIASPGPGSKRRRPRKWPLGLLAVVAAGIAATAIILSRGGDDLRHFTAEVQEGDIRDTVESTGTVNAVVNVQVGSQVSGTIDRLDADFNSRVHKGEVIATIDPSLFRGALKQAQADLESAEANVLASEAGKKRAQATLVQAKADYQRAESLVADKLIAPAGFDLALASFKTAEAALEGADAMLIQARAQVSQKEAAVSVARTNLEYTVIRSPIDGVVVARNVDVGQTVAASLQAPTIFTIAQDLTKMLLYAKVDEADVGRIRHGQSVTFKVDAFPQEQFGGTVREIRMNPTTVQNVVTYDTVIEFENPELKIFPGMTAYVSIPVATVERVVKVPNAALRYKPPLPAGSIRALYARYGVDDKAVSPEAAKVGRELGAIVWKLLADGSLEPVRVSLGITDHTFTEVRRVVTGALAPGERVVTSSVKSRTLTPGVQGIGR